MQITKIAPNGDKFSKIYADGEYVLTLANEIIKKYSLCEGMEFDEKVFSALSKASQIRKARERMLYALDRRPHSQRELRDKLKKDYPPDIIDSALDEIASLGLVDDYKFSLAFCEHRKNVQKKGPYAVKSELIMLKGVDRETAQAAVDEVFSDSSELLDAALGVLQRYDLETENGKRRAYAALVRKGYSSDIIRKAMNSIED